jgi:hypothetical protein
MKKLILSSILFLAVSFAISAQNSSMFEYKIISSAGATGSMKMFYSTPGSRMEMTMKMSDPKMSSFALNRTTITKKDKPLTVYTLDDKTKTYSVSETKASTTPSTDKPEDYTVKIVGKEKIGIYNCIHSIVTKGARTNEFWTSTEISEYEKYNKAKGETKYMGSSAEYEALVKKGAAGFIVKTLTTDTKGGTFTMELVTFDKKDLATSLFEIPAGYKETATTPVGVPGMPSIDVTKLQNMTPEERAKYIEDMKKQYGAPPTQPN